MGAGLLRGTQVEKLPLSETSTEAVWAAPRKHSSRISTRLVQRRAKEGLAATGTSDATPHALELTDDVTGSIPTAAMAPASPKSTASSRSDLDRWSEPSETVIIFDWDDTLFPTSYLRHQVGYIRTSIEHPTELPQIAGEAMRFHTKVVNDLLRLAGRLGQVLIVTMATEIWVSQCAEKHMPGCHDLLQAVGAQVVAARCGVPVKQKRQACSNDRDPSQYLKTCAMQRAVRDFYTKGRRRSWKNLVSIGDSSAERCALQDVVFRRVQRSRHGRWKECRCKTLMLMQEPSLEQLTAQLQRVRQSLPALVTHDGDVDTILDSLDDVLCESDNTHLPESTQLPPACVFRASDVDGLFDSVDDVLYETERICQPEIVAMDWPHLPGTPTANFDAP